MRATSQINLATTVVVLAILTIGGMAYFAIARISRPLQNTLPRAIERLERDMRLDRLAQLIRFYDEILTQSARNYAFTGQVKWKDRYQRAEPELDGYIKQAMADGDQEDVALFRQIDAANTALVDMEHRALLAVDEGRRSAAQAILDSENYQRQKDIYKQGLDRHAASESAQANASLANSRDLLALALVSAQKDVMASRFWMMLAVGIGLAVVAVLSLLALQFVKAREAIGKVDARYHALFENYSDAMMTTTDTGRFLDCNLAALRMFGYTGKEDFMALQPGDVSPPYQPSGQDSRTAVDQRIAEAFASGTNRFEWVHRRRTGDDFPAEVLLTAFQLDGKRILQATVRDITERKKSEAERERLSAQLIRIRAALEDTTNAVLITDSSGQATYVNMAFGHISHYTLDDLNRISLAAIFEESKVAAEIINSIQEGGTWRGEQTVLVNGGGTVPVLVRGTAILDDEYNLNGAIFLMTDLTERKRMEADSLQHQKLESIGQLAAGIAHEINTPTQYIGDHTRFLKDAFEDLDRLLIKYEELIETSKADGMTLGLLDKIVKAREDADLDYLRERVPKAIDQALEGVDRVATIVRAMKDFSHPGPLEKTPTDLNRGIESTVTVARSEWKYVADMAIETDEDLPLVNCVPGEINQVILNIIVNAAHAIGDMVGPAGEKGKGRITITTRQDGSWVEIRIGDTGTGIPKHVQPRIFDPFFTTKEVGKGTGQGLTIAYNVITKKHGGSLAFETEPGKGTTFIIRLPMGAKG